MRWRLAVPLLGVLAAGLVTEVSAARAATADAASRRGFQAEAMALLNRAQVEAPDYILVASADRLTRYYFSKPGSPAYPFALKLRIAVKPSSGDGGCRDIDVPMTTSAEDADDAAYEAADRWMSAIENGVIKEYASASRR